jgi:hypothetical protein
MRHQGQLSFQRRRGRMGGFGKFAALIAALAVVWLVVRVGADGRGGGPLVAEHDAVGEETAPGAFENRSVERFSDLEAFRNVPYADALQDEQRLLAGALPFDPVTGTTTGTFEGTYTNVVDGVRRTRASSCRGCAEADVWLVGGSVAFGLGQRDDHTVASELVRLADEEGIALRVVNLAVPGWTSWQEHQAISARLGSEAPPDVVLSIGGFNDVAAAATTLAVDPGDEDPRNILDPATIEQFARDALTVEDAGGIERVVEVATARYLRWHRVLVQEARAAGAATLAIFHPDAMATPTQFQPVAGAVRGLPASSAADLEYSSVGPLRSSSPRC